jgi:hypothetical protein
MTKRAVIIGLAGVVFVSAVCYFFDEVIRQGLFISSLMPVAVYGTLVLFALSLQPLLALFGARLRFSGAEVCLILCFVLLACGLPGLGLVQYLPPAAMFPHHDARLRPGWASEEVVAIAPPQMLADIREDESRALGGYVTGLSVGNRRIGVSEVPWSAWTRTLAFWLPLLLAATVALLALSTVFHTQWARHEQLPYPITTFTKALLPDRTGRLPVLGSRLFWIGFLSVFTIQLNNYLLRWLPDVLIPIKTTFDCTALAKLTPVLTEGAGTGIYQLSIWWPVLGLAYFLPTDVSFTMTVTPFIYCTIFGAFAMVGVPFRCGRMLGPSLEQSIYAGGYFAILLMLLYTGRYYYLNVLRQSLGITSRETVEPHAVWGMRVFLVCTLLFIVQLVLVGLDWQLAILYTGLAYMVHVVVSRMIAETGGFIIGTYVYPCVMIWALCGTTALGPKTLLTMFLVSTVLVSGPGWAPMPFFVQALKLGDVFQLDLGRLARWGVAIVVLSVLVAVPCNLYWQYSRGAPTVGWPRATAWYSFENMVEVKQTLRAQELLETAESLRGWERCAHLVPDSKQLSAFLIAMAIALVLAFGRLRFPKWPLHPMAFVFLGGWPACYHWFSFLLAWALKICVTKYGGARLYDRLKPLMVGLIAGSMLGSLVPMVVGSVYYFVAGQPP